MPMIGSHFQAGIPALGRQSEWGSALPCQVKARLAPSPTCMNPKMSPEISPCSLSHPAGYVIGQAVLMALAFWSRQACMRPFPRRNHQTADSYGYLRGNRIRRDLAVSEQTVEQSAVYNTVSCPFIVSHKLQYFPSSEIPLVRSCDMLSASSGGSSR